MGSKGLDDFRQWIRQNAWEIRLARETHGKREPFRRRRELSIDIGSIPTRVDAIPADALKPNAIQPMETKPSPIGIEAQPLITEPSADAIRAKQRRQKMTLGVAVATAFSKNFGCRTGNDSEPMVAGVFDFVSNPFKATTSNGRRISQVPTQDVSVSHDGGMLPINDVGGLEKRIHVFALLIGLTA